MIQPFVNYDRRQWDFFRTDQGKVRRSLPVGRGVAGVQARNAAVLSSQLWLRLGRYAIALRRARVLQGVGSNDNTMKPLSGKTSAVTANGKFVRQRAGYAQWKMAHGLSGIRDLWGPGKGGHMLDQMRVTEVSESGVKIDITTRMGRAKARANERRSPWIGFSRGERAKILAEFGRLFKQECRDFTDALAAVGAVASKRFASVLRRAA